jgi:hypothetical protein
MRTKSKTRRRQAFTMASAIYDLRCAPITFDYCNFLAIAYMRSVARGERFFDLVIRADSYRNLTPREKHYSLKEREWRLYNLILEVSKITSTCRNICINRDREWINTDDELVPEYNSVNRHGTPYLLRHSIATFKHTGIRPVLFRPTAYASDAVSRLFGEGPIATLSLRRAEFDVERNADLDAWQEVEGLAKKLGVKLIVLPDQDDSLSERKTESKAWQVFGPSAFSLDLRLAIMRRSVLNIVTSGGINAPLWYSDIRYVAFNIIHKEHYVANPEYIKKSTDLEIGDSLPWSAPEQIFEWELTDPVSIFEKYIS